MGLFCHLLRIDSKEDLLLSPHKGAVVETFAVAELLKSRCNIGKKHKSFILHKKTMAK